MAYNFRGFNKCGFLLESGAIKQWMLLKLMLHRLSETGSCFIAHFHFRWTKPINFSSHAFITESASISMFAPPFIYAKLAFLPIKLNSTMVSENCVHRYHGRSLFFLDWWKFTKDWSTTENSCNYDVINMKCESMGKQ